jgi:hypothetical protein
MSDVFCVPFETPRHLERFRGGAVEFRTAAIPYADLEIVGATIEIRQAGRTQARVERIAIHVDEVRADLNRLQDGGWRTGRAIALPRGVACVVVVTLSPGTGDMHVDGSILARTAETAAVPKGGTPRINAERDRG